MFKDFQLGTLVKIGHQWKLLRIPLHQDLQSALAADWYQQYEEFTAETKEITFDAGYRPEEHECFRVKDYTLPAWLEAGTGNRLRNLDSISEHEGSIPSIKAVVAFARNEQGE